MIQDEAIFIADARPRRVYTAKGRRTVCCVSGTHARTIVYGAVSLDGRQPFRQYDKFNKETFVEYLRDVKKEFGKVLVIADKAPQHTANMVKEELGRMDDIEIECLPTAASPELSVVEECRRHSKYSILQVFYSTITRLREDITGYFEHKKFNLDPTGYLLRTIVP